MLLRLPKNRNKGSLRGLPLAEQLKVTTAPRLSAVTINKHLISYSAFYDWAVKRKETEENNFRVLIDNVKNAHTEREEFSPEQTKRILHAAMQANELHHKWDVLIGFYTGARVNEIAQLDTADIVQEEGIWCFGFTDSGERKRLKSKSSKRTIPVHSRLIELGFLDMVHDAGKGKLTELRIHAIIEEELLYPALRGKQEVDQDLLNESDEEHHVAKLLIGELITMTSEDHFAAKFTVLAENIEHHVKEEESDLFPQAHKTDIDFVALGKKLNARKQELKKNGIPLNAEEKLMMQAGLHDSSADAAKKRRAA